MRSMRLIMIALASLALFTTAGVALAGQDPDTILDQKMDHGSWQSRVQWEDGFVQVTAQAGADPQKAVSVAHAETMALKAARYLAYEKLLELIQGLDVDSRTTIKREMLDDSTLRTRLAGMVRGARVVEERVDRREDGSVMASVSLELPLNSRKGLSAAMAPWFNKQVKTEVVKPTVVAKPTKQPTPTPTPKPTVIAPTPTPTPKPTATPKPTPAAMREYTGLIIIAEGLDARPALFPRILDQTSGKELYGPAQVDKTYAVERGVVGYATSLAKARTLARVGDNPLVLKAESVLGPGKANLVLGHKQAVKLLAADLSGGFLAKCAVAIVLK